MIVGKVTDKETKAPIPGVKVILTNQTGSYIKDRDGLIEAVTDSKGQYEIEMQPGQYIEFNMHAYPVVTKSYEEAVRKPDVEMDDASGTALSLAEVRALMKDAAKQVNGKWLVGVGIGIIALVLLAILAKKQGWI